MKASVRTTLKLLSPHARRHVWAFVAIVILGGISAMGQRLMVLLLDPALELMFPGQTKGGIALAGKHGVLVEAAIGVRQWIVGDASDVSTRMSALGRIALVMSVIAVVIAFAQYGFTLLARWVAVRMVVDLRVRIARHLMGLSMAYHGRRHFGDLLSRVSNDVSTTLLVLNLAIKELVQEPLLASWSLIMAGVIAPLPTLFVALGLVVVAVPVAILSRKVRRGSTKSLTTLGSSVQALSQMFQGVRAVKAFRAEDREIERYREINEGYVRSTMRMVRALALSNAWTLFISHVGMGLLVLVIGYMTIVHGHFDNVTEMATFFLYVSTVYGSIKVITKTVTQVQESVGASERLQALLDEEADVVEKVGASEARGLGSGLKFEGVTFAYVDGDGNALEELDLEVRPGETLALVGPSGAGKSTVVDLVARFIDPSRGRVSVDGRDLRDYTLDSWTAQYAMVGQTPFLFHATIEENIRYGKPIASKAEVEAAARAAGIHDFIVALPDGYATNVADAGSRLSGGQRQRITIARAFLKGAPLLLLDEATSALDTESEAVVQQALQRLMTDRTVIVIAHRLSTIRDADRIAVLEKGRLAELGTHDELIARNGAYARLYAAQFGGTQDVPALAGSS